MSKTIYDAESAGALLVPATTIVTTTPFPGQLVHPRWLPTASWVLDVQGAASTGTYLFLLEVSATLGGSYSEIARFAWPAGRTEPQQVALGVSASMASLVDPESQYLRVRVTIGGVTPSLSFSSWLGKPGGAVGLGLRAGEVGIAGTG